jgi:Restriction endonuclease NaeI
MPAPRARFARRSSTEPHKVPGFAPPARGEDSRLDAVFDALRAADPVGAKVATVLRETYDQIYDGQRTGRYRWDQLLKTEKTFMGTLVEINLHRAFLFEDGVRMDYRIAGVEVDCKFSQSLGGWMIPPEAYEQQHIVLLIWASEDANRWEAGLVRARDDDDFLGRENRDRKRPLTPVGESTVRWLYNRPALPENLLLHIDDETRARIFNPVPRRTRAPSGQEKINMLFRLVQRRIVNRAAVLTVAQQRDSPKRARDARLPQNLGNEGILVLGHQERDPMVAEALGLPVPRKGDFVSARVVPAKPGFAGPVAVIEAGGWRLASEDDPVVAAPIMPRVSRRAGD